MSVCLLLACSLLSPGSGPAVEPDAVGDWPTFLGPSGDGIAAAKTLKTAVPDAESVLAWTEEIGEGYSAPVVVTLKGSDEEEPRRVLFSHRREGRQETLTRRDLATGKTEWTVAAPTAFRDPYGYNGGPRASPLAVPNAAGDGGFVYTLGAAGRASCVDIKTGEERWSRDFNAELNIPRWFFGVGGSPVLFEPQTTANPRGEPLVIFAPGGQPNAGVVAVKPDTGETVWEAVGRQTWDGTETGRGPYDWTGEEQVVSYSTPTLATIRGEPHLLCLVRHGLVSLDPRTGQQRFAFWFRSRKYESVNAVRPAVIGDRILLCAAYEVGSALLEVNQAGDGVTEVWRNPRALGCHWSTPVIHEGHAYGFAGRHEREGELHCVDLATGELKWAASGREDAGEIQFARSAGGYVDAEGNKVPFPDFGRGSCILAPDAAKSGTLYILGERGTLFCATPSPQGYQERSRTAVPKITYPAWPAPVLSHGYLLLADEDSLTALDLRK